MCLGEGAIASVLFGALPKGTSPLIVGKPHQPLLDIVHTAYVPLPLPLHSLSLD